MKKTVMSFIILLTLLFCCGVTYADNLALAVTQDRNALVLENELMIRRFDFSPKSSGAIKVSVTSRETGAVVSSGSQPYFEFVIDNTLVTANDKLWRYRSFSERAMGNGGKEVTLVFEGRKKPVKGLELHIVQQIFTGTTLVREQLRLESSGRGKFNLNKLDGALHFRFPCYSVENAENVSSTEIRIASWAGELIDTDSAAAQDERFQYRKYNDHNLANCHMFHPRVLRETLEQNGERTMKGPLAIAETASVNWISAYEHASQDDIKGFYGEDDSSGRDALQGTVGTFDFTIEDSDMHFLGIRQEKKNGRLDISLDILRGGYLDGETIDRKHPYKTVWNASAFYHERGIDKGKEIIRDYLWRCICEKDASRRPSFYYNSWGMQRSFQDDGGVRARVNEQYMIEEIRRAAEMGIDTFVLDDGWEQYHGGWTANTERFPNGLAPIKAELDRHGMKMGLWFSPLGTQTDAERYHEHPDWIVLDSIGQPVRSQWNNPVFDFVGPFRDAFVDDCKKLIDQGARYFKWDAINTVFSAQPNLDHGSDKYSKEELRARYEYLLPIYVTEAMEELTDYEPELVIEMDLTEAKRVMCGLCILSQGKFYWINNGASWYKDYYAFRTKSIRTVHNEFADIIPLELFTCANYPHNNKGFQRYNVNTSIIAGHGFWGALELTSEADRQFIGSQLAKAKQVLPYVAGSAPEIIGRVGASPEIYTQVNSDEAAGQVVAFSGQAMHYHHAVQLAQDKLLGVMNHAYSVDRNTLFLRFGFPMPDATREAFIIPNEGRNITVLKSSSWLDTLDLADGTLSYTVGAAGEQTIRWGSENGEPEVASREGISAEITKKENNYIIKVTTAEKGLNVSISGR